jgi:hypothetical protein
MAPQVKCRFGRGARRTLGAPAAAHGDRLTVRIGRLDGTVLKPPVRRAGGAGAVQGGACEPGRGGRGLCVVLDRSPRNGWMRAMPPLQ